MLSGSLHTTAPRSESSQSVPMSRQGCPIGCTPAQKNGGTLSKALLLIQLSLIPYHSMLLMGLVSSWNSTIASETNTLISALDLDEYLPPITLNQCKRMLAKHGIDLHKISSREHLPDGTYLHCHAYALLRAELQVHTCKGHEPELRESEKPLMSDPPRPDLVQSFRDAHQHLEVDGVVYAS